MNIFIKTILKESETDLSLDDAIINWIDMSDDKLEKEMKVILSANIPSSLKYDGKVVYRAVGFTKKDWKLFRVGKINYTTSKLTSWSKDLRSAEDISNHDFFNAKDLIVLFKAKLNNSVIDLTKWAKISKRKEVKEFIKDIVDDEQEVLFGQNTLTIKDVHHIILDGWDCDIDGERIF